MNAAAAKRRRWWMELLDETAADRDGDGLGAVVRAELLEEPPEVRLHRVRADPEVVGDLLGRRAVRDLLEDLLLALRQGRGLDPLLRELDLLDERRRESRMDDGLALERQSCGVHQLVGGGVLEQVARDARLDGLGDRGTGLVHREQDHAGLRGSRTDRLRRLDAP